MIDWVRSHTKSQPMLQPHRLWQKMYSFLPSWIAEKMIAFILHSFLSKKVKKIITNFIKDCKKKKKKTYKHKGGRRKEKEDITHWLIGIRSFCGFLIYNKRNFLNQQVTLIAHIKQELCCQNDHRSSKLEWHLSCMCAFTLLVSLVFFLDLKWHGCCYHILSSNFSYMVCGFLFSANYGLESDRSQFSLDNIF